MWTLQVMQGMLGQWSKDSGAAHHPRSGLATTIAQNGLADRMTAFNSPYHDTGLEEEYVCCLVPPNQMHNLREEPRPSN